MLNAKYDKTQVEGIMNAQEKTWSKEV